MATEEFVPLVGKNIARTLRTCVLGVFEEYIFEEYKQRTQALLLL